MKKDITLTALTMLGLFIALIIHSTTLMFITLGTSAVLFLIGAMYADLKEKDKE